MIILIRAYVFYVAMMKEKFTAGKVVTSKGTRVVCIEFNAFIYFVDGAAYGLDMIVCFMWHTHTWN